MFIYSNQLQYSDQFNTWSFALSKSIHKLEPKLETNETETLSKTNIACGRIRKPVIFEDNKVKMNLNRMEPDVYYPVKYKNTKYFVGSSKDGVIDVYKVK